MTKTFPVETILSITTDRLLTPMGEVYNILNFMTDSELLTHQLPAASDRCKPVIFEALPEISSVNDDLPMLDTLIKTMPDACLYWVECMKKKYHLSDEYQISR